MRACDINKNIKINLKKIAQGESIDNPRNSSGDIDTSCEILVENDNFESGDLNKALRIIHSQALNHMTNLGCTKRQVDECMSTYNKTQSNLYKIYKDFVN